MFRIETIHSSFICHSSELQRVHVFSSPSPACLELSPSLSPSLSLTGQDSSPSPAGFESESGCPWLGSESRVPIKERNFLALVQVIFRNTINNIIVILIPLHDVSLC